MYKIRLVMVPPGGGEADYSLVMEVPALPRAGDYITVVRKRRRGAWPEEIGTDDFVVRRVWWSFNFPDEGRSVPIAGPAPVGTLRDIAVECEYAIGRHSSVQHKLKCGPNAQTFEASAY